MTFSEKHVFVQSRLHFKCFRTTLQSFLKHI